MRVQRPKGTVDILPETSGQWEKVEQTARDLFKRANYHEIRTPSFENYELFSRSSGETSDVVEKECTILKTRAAATSPSGQKARLG